MGYVITPTEKRFVYGRFHWPGKEGQVEPPPPPTWHSAPHGWDLVAIEILREYSANELMGKVYIRGLSRDWTPATETTIEQLEWHRWYNRLPAQARTSGRQFYFDMEGSGRWKVLHFRSESDATGPYIAVALQYIG